MRWSKWTPEQYRQKPRDYDPRMADLILDRISNGETLVEICEDRDLPLPGTFLEWVEQEPLLSDRYKKARERGYDVRHDSVLSTVASIPDNHRARLFLDALKFDVQTGHPAKYGPRNTLTIPKPQEDAGGGIDYSQELRRKFEAMAERFKGENPPPATPSADPPV